MNDQPQDQINQQWQQVIAFCSDSVVMKGKEHHSATRTEGFEVMP